MEDPTDFRPPHTMLVVGGGDGMPMWLVKRVFADRPEIQSITLADIKPLHHGYPQACDTNPGRRHIAELRRIDKPVYAALMDYGGSRSDLLSDWRPVNESAARALRSPSIEASDLIMIGVPEEEIPRVAETVMPRISPGTWLFDITSAKGPVLDILVANAPEDVSVLGTHPLFGPAVPDMVGQTVAFSATARRDSQFYDWLEGVFASADAMTEWVDPYEHDKYMLKVQAMTHFTYLAFAKSLANDTDNGFSLRKSYRFSTPPYGILTAFTARIIGTNPRLYAQIQDQDGAEDVRAKFVAAAQELQEQFLGSRAQIQKAITEIVAPFRGHEIARGFSQSVSLASTVQAGHRDLFDRSRTGKLTVMNVGDPMDPSDPSTVHVGLVRQVDGESVTMAERHVVRDGKSYIAHDDESESAIAKFGVNAPERVRKIHRHNIRRVLSDEETVAWRRDNLRHHVRDISVLAENTRDLGYVCDVVKRINDSVVSGEVVDTVNSDWLGWFGVKNRLLRIHIFGDRDPDLVVAKLEEELEILGVRTRR